MTVPLPAWTLEQSAEIADHWQQHRVAADAGDERASEFLSTFAPWASEQLANRLKS